MGVAGALRAFGVDVVGQGLIDIEQVAAHQGDGDLLEEVLFVEPLAREVVGERDLAQLNPGVLHDAGRSEVGTPAAEVGHVFIEIMYYMIVLDGFARLGVDAVARQNNAVVTDKLAVFVVIFQVN